MNNIKDFLYENILNDVDSKIDNRSELDDAVNNALYNKVINALGFNNSYKYGDIKYSWDKKTKTIKIDQNQGYFMYLFVDENKICIYNGSYCIELDELVNAGVKFDCDLQVNVKCIDLGLRLSHCNIVGKKHILRIRTTTGEKSIDINRLVDTQPSCFDTIMIPLGVVDVQRCLNTLSKFKYCVFTNNGYHIKDTWQEEILKIHDLKCDVIYTQDMAWNTNNKVGSGRVSIVLDYETSHRRQPMTEWWQSLSGICKKLIESNPDVKVLIGAGANDVIQVWEEDNTLKYKEIVRRARTPFAASWRKVK